MADRVERTLEVLEPKEEVLEVGPFSDWLERFEEAERRAEETAVPCGDCTACCRSSLFVHIEPDEVETLAAIPSELLFPAPGRPSGHVLLGYDSEGSCPMLSSSGCTIYATRPRACRLFDCRVLVPGAEAGWEEDSAVVRQAHRWRFELPTPRDRRQRAAVAAAGRFLCLHGEHFPPGFLPGRAVQLARLALRVHRAFLGFVDDDGEVGALPETAEFAAAIVAEAGLERRDSDRSPADHKAE